jgi:hypothetical protein
MGRPSRYKQEYAEQAYKLCLLGAKDEDLADFFGVQVSTLNNWKKAHKDFMESLKEGKDIADATISESLFHRAKGYSHPEDKIFCSKDGDVTTVATTKHYPPDTTACIFWLKNRQKEHWRDVKEQRIDNPAGAAQAVAISRLTEFLEEHAPPGAPGHHANLGQDGPVLPPEVPPKSH